MADKVAPMPSPPYTSGYDSAKYNVVTSQPISPVVQTTVVINQPSLGKRWNTQLCDCCADMKICCCVFWLGQCYYGCIADRMGENCCVGYSGYSGGCVPGGHLAMRSHFRGKHGIEGSICDDCCVMTCCVPCGMCQLAREMDFQGYTKGSC